MSSVDISRATSTLDEKLCKAFFPWGVLVVLSLFCAYKYWGSLAASPDTVAEIDRKARAAQLENCRVGEWSSWGLSNYGPAESFIERRLEENRPVLNSEVADLNSVIRSCQDQASKFAEDKRLAAAQKAATNP